MFVDDGAAVVGIGDQAFYVDVGNLEIGDLSALDDGLIRYPGLLEELGDLPRVVDAREVLYPFNGLSVAENI